MEDLISGFVVVLVLNCFFARLSSTQSLSDNGFGDAVASVYKSQPESLNGTAEEKEKLLNTILVSSFIKPSPKALQLTPCRRVI